MRAGLAKAIEDRPADMRALVLSLRDAAREVVRLRRRGETPKEVAAVADFQDEDLASRSGEAEVQESGQVLDELPPTQASSATVARAAVAEAAAEAAAEASPDVSNVPTRSVKRRGLWQASRALSRHLSAPGLLAPRWRPWILGAAFSVAAGGMFLLWRSHAEPPPPPSSPPPSTQP